MLSTQPQLDQAGNVIPHDHQEILNTDGIIRRVSPYHIVEYPKVVGGRRISSSLFRESSEPPGGMSIDLMRPLEEGGFDAAVIVTVEPHIAAVVLLAHEFRTLEFRVGYDPLPANPYHGEVWGIFSKSKQRTLLRTCAWLVPVPGIIHPSGPNTYPVHFQST